MSHPEIEDIEVLREELDALFERDEDEERWTGDYPHDRLEKLHHLDLSYLKGLDFDGSTSHRHTRACLRDDGWYRALRRNSDVPLRLFEAALRLFADSILAYHGRTEREGSLRYYPPIVLTFWSGLETFVRFSSELMLNTVKDVPPEVANHLREVESGLDPRGHIKRTKRTHPVLERYAVLLKHGYGYEVDRGHKHWQGLEKAKQLRDYYTHLDVSEPRSLSSTDVLVFAEAVLLGIIWPSSELKRTQFLGVYRLYDVWDGLRDAAEKFTEQPFFKDRPFLGVQSFHCPFENVDTAMFPNGEERR